MKEIRGTKVLIAGLGIEGKSTLKYLEENHKDLDITIADKNVDDELAKNYNFLSGEDYLDNLQEYDTVVRSPGIPLELFKSAKHVTSHTNIFFENCPGKVIAITGTKGKSTTTTLIYDLLKTTHKDVRLIGNIGKPALDSLKSAASETIFVFEISSFQLEDVHYSPHIAAVLAITSDHIDRHGNLDKYVLAKQNIVMKQTKDDFVFYNADDENASKIAKASKATKMPVHYTKVPFKTALIGKGNEINIAMAIAVAKHYEVPEEQIKNILTNFKPLPHRIENIGQYNGITFYDDSIATNPDASLNGIRALGDKLETVIVGGANKGFDFDEYVKAVSKLNIKNIILMPDTGHEMKDDLEKHAKNSKILIANTMKEAVKLAYKNTESGKSVLLSPAATSFNMFTDYKERGEVFKKFVLELA
jgi:UDP-N-acetylmuramoylalanine--D-glutamate ligase